MPEADWWLCDACQSLNNLSARKCYSCHRRKPKRSQRASQFLNYVPVITWDKRVRFEDPPTLAVEVEEKHVELHRRPPPLREPVPRHITAVAPPVPHGARITYRLVESPIPPLPPRGFVPPPSGPPPGPAPDSPLARLGIVAPGHQLPPPSLPQLVAIPVGSGAPPQLPQPALMALQPQQPQPSQPSQRPLVAIPIEPATVAPTAVPVAAGWAHWRELLDVPTPDPTRLRRAFTTSTPSGRTKDVESWPDESTAVRGEAAGVGVAEPAAPVVEWPAEDLNGKRDA